MKNIIQRTLTGIVYVVVVVAAVGVHPFIFADAQPLVFAGVFSVVVGLLIHEFYVLTKYENPLWLRLLGIAGGMYFFVASCLYAGNYVGNEIYIPYLLLMLILLISGLYLRDRNPITQWGLTFFAQCYCAGLLSFLCFIPYLQSPVYDSFPILMIFIFIWLNDIGAYLIGSWKGKHRLFPRISPLKSYEGLGGGLAVVIIASLVFSHFYTEMAWYKWLSFAVITVISATYGDLLESLIKRTCGVKDSGKILPGHGGMLDRFDSMILAAPVMYIFFKLTIGK